MSEEQTNLVEEAASAESTTQEQETVETAATESTEEAICIPIVLKPSFWVKPLVMH